MKKNAKLKYQSLFSHASTRIYRQKFQQVLLSIGLFVSFMGCCLTGAQAATAMTDSMMAQPISGLGKFDTLVLNRVQQDAQKPVVQQQMLQSYLAGERSEQLQQLSLDLTALDFLRTERLDRLATQTRDQLRANDLFVAQLDAQTAVTLLLDSLAIYGQEIGVENVKGTVIIEVSFNP